MRPSKKTKQYVPKFTTIESIDTFKDFSTIFASGKFKTGYGGQFRTCYEPKEGDLIDAKIAQVMNDCKLQIKVKRLKNSTY